MRLIINAMSRKKTTAEKPPAKPAAAPPAKPAEDESRAKEIGGPAGPEPTRYGDWEINGRCVDF